MPATPADPSPPPAHGPDGHLAPGDEAPAAGERTDVLHRHGDLVIEHILSSAAVDPVVYDQDHDEWVVLLEGRATLDVDGTTIDLTAGDWLLLRAHERHTVLSTTQGTRWLAVHLPS